MPKPKRTPRAAPARTVELTTATRVCPGCNRPLWAAYKGYRVVATLEGLTRFAVQVRRCRNVGCPRHNVSLRAQAEGAIALPQQEFGLDVIALIGRLRHVEHRSITEIHAELIRLACPSACGASPACWTATMSCSPSRCPIRPGCVASPPRPGG